MAKPASELEGLAVVEVPRAVPPPLAAGADSEEPGLPGIASPSLGSTHDE